jgi:hypothetical protein
MVSVAGLPTALKHAVNQLHASWLAEGLLPTLLEARGASVRCSGAGHT